MTTSNSDNNNNIQSVFEILNAELNCLPGEVSLIDPNSLSVVFTRDDFSRMSIREHPEEEFMPLESISIRLVLLTLHVMWNNGEYRIGFSLLKKGFQNMSIPIETPHDISPDAIAQFCLALLRFST